MLHRALDKVVLWVNTLSILATTSGYYNYGVPVWQDISCLRLKKCAVICLREAVHKINILLEHNGCIYVYSHF